MFECTAAVSHNYWFVEDPRHPQFPLLWDLTVSVTHLKPLTLPPRNPPQGFFFSFPGLAPAAVPPRRTSISSLYRWEQRAAAVKR